MGIIMSKEEEKLLYEQFLKNQEKLWDLAAITAAPTLLQLYEGKDVPEDVFKLVANEAYELAEALMAERRMRFLKEIKPDAKSND